MPARLLSLLITLRVGGLLLAALCIWLFAQLADEVLEQETLVLDTLILQAIKPWHAPWLDQVMFGITFLGEPNVLTITSLGLGVWLLIQSRRFEAATLAIAVCGVTGLNFWLKQLFARARPELWERTIDVRYYSFPSGHAMISLVIYGLIGYLLTRQFQRWRGLILSLMVLLVVAIGFSRLYFGVHWPTDILAGYAAGSVWLIACILSSELWQEYRSRRRSLDQPEELPSE